MIEEVKSVLAKSLVVACPTCGANIGDLCRRPDGQAVMFKGHAGVHLPRMIAARHVKKDSA